VLLLFRYGVIIFLWCNCFAMVLSFCRGVIVLLWCYYCFAIWCYYCFAVVLLVFCCDVVAIITMAVILLSACQQLKKNLCAGPLDILPTFSGPNEELISQYSISSVLDTGADLSKVLGDKWWQ